MVGGENSKVSFSMIVNDIPLNKVINQEGLNQSGLTNFSMHSLPLEEQTIAKGILFIPVGVLIVVFMRILVGIRTSGNFMPFLKKCSILYETTVI